MRVIEQISVPYNNSPNLPFGGIKNETLTEPGTPVVEEIYGDILSNLYKLMQTVGIEPSGTQDNDATQYQILEALKKLSNVLNDIEQPMLLTGTVWSVGMKLQFLPNKYVFIAKPSEAFNPSFTYTLIGNDTSPTPLAVSCPSGFDANAEVMVVLDNSTVRMYPLNFDDFKDKVIQIALGSPLPFNNSGTVYAFENGKLYSNTPTVTNIELTLQTFTSDGTLLVLQAFILQGHLLCFTTNSANEYKFYQFALNALNSPVLVDYTIANAVDYTPYCYTNGTAIYITNDANTTADDYWFRKANYDAVDAEMTDVDTTILESSFIKTTNAVLKPNAIITLISGSLVSFGLDVDNRIELGDYDFALGNLFYFKNSFYFGASDIASKWSL